MEQRVKSITILLITWFLPCTLVSAQTPFDAFSPETSRIILDGDSIAAWRAEQQSQLSRRNTTLSRPDTILCALIADLRNEQLLLVDIASHRPIAAAPFTDEIKNWLSVDPLVDKNITTSPYLYCNGNPIMFIDPDGRYCVGANLEIAEGSMKEIDAEISNKMQQIGDIQSEIERQELEGIDCSAGRMFVSELKEHIMELTKSKNDFQDMIDDPWYEYQFNNVNGCATPVTTCTSRNANGHSVVVMTYGTKDCKFAEARHGGQNARREIRFMYIPFFYAGKTYGLQLLSRYGVEDEVDQYRAQIPWVSGARLHLIVSRTGRTKDVGIFDITPKLIKSIYENGKRLYNF